MRGNSGPFNERASSAERHAENKMPRREDSPERESDSSNDTAPAGRAPHLDLDLDLDLGGGDKSERRCDVAKLYIRTKVGVTVRVRVRVMVRVRVRVLTGFRLFGSFPLPSAQPRPSCLFFRQ